MNLRERFEKETGQTWNIVPVIEYIEWLEQRNKEQVETLRLVHSELEALDDWGKEISTLTIYEITNQLIKAGEL